MGGELNFNKGFERGPWYEIKATRDVIISKESRGEDTSFERGLLKSWAKYPGWEEAGEPIGKANKSKSRAIGSL